METISSHLRMSRNKAIDGQPSVQGIVLVLPCTIISPYLHMKCLKVLIGFKLSHYWASTSWPGLCVSLRQTGLQVNSHSFYCLIFGSRITFCMSLQRIYVAFSTHTCHQFVHMFVVVRKSFHIAYVDGMGGRYCTLGACPSRNSIAVLCILYHTSSPSSRKSLTLRSWSDAVASFCSKALWCMHSTDLFCAGNVVKVFYIDASPPYVTTRFGKFSTYILNHNLFVYSLLTSFPCLLILTAVLSIGTIGTPPSILSAVMRVRM